MYINAVNFYGLAMSEELPFSDFEWLSTISGARQRPP